MASHKEERVLGSDLLTLCIVLFLLVTKEVCQSFRTLISNILGIMRVQTDHKLTTPGL